jgi:hypothetical protein
METTNNVHPTYEVGQEVYGYFDRCFIKGELHMVDSKLFWLKLPTGFFTTKIIGKTLDECWNKAHAYLEDSVRVEHLYIDKARDTYYQGKEVQDEG